MILLYLCLLIGPALLIVTWDRLVLSLVPNAWPVYRITGILGTPFHELAHALACVLFGLRITKIALYAPDPATGTMGYVNFSYNPRSVRHQFGCLIQGIAPLIAGCVLVVIVLRSAETSPPAPGALELAGWLWSAVLQAVVGIFHLAQEDLAGASLALLVMIISMHCIPSPADIKVGMSAFLALLALGAGVSLVLYVFTGLSLHSALSLGFIASFVDALEATMWRFLHAVVSVVTLAILASVFFIILPACVARVFGALTRPRA